MMQSWYQEMPGKWLSYLEQQQVEKWLGVLNGCNLVQFGGKKNCLTQLGNFRYYYAAMAREHLELPATDTVLFDEQELPFQRHSIDTVILWHTLEFVDEPVVLLKEIYDCLAPGGTLLIFGFNPWSLWGLTKLLSTDAPFPWKGRYWSRGRVRQWLSILGYNYMHSKTLCFCPPFTRETLFRGGMFWEALGQVCAPASGGSYFILAQKKGFAGLLQKASASQEARLFNKDLMPST
jgi:SAM-dependent methyltransferase